MLPSLISIVIFGIAIAFHGLLLKYIWDLEKHPDCECSKNWNRDFIKYYLVASIVFLCFNILRVLLGVGNNALTLTVSTVMQLLGIVNLFVMFFYTQKLKNTDCTCSADWRRTFMNVYSFIMLAFFPIVTIVILAITLLSGKVSLNK
jgi:uncharacterized membrane protein YesL